MIHIKAPTPFYEPNSYTIFLGGSIDMGAAENWQNRLAEALVDEDVVLLNPRRDDWDSSWTQDPTAGTQFYEQVSWELEMQDNASLLVYYFADGSASPITLLELGLYSRRNVIVYCTDKFYRYGNVAMVCDKHEIHLVSSFDELIEALKQNISFAKMIDTIN